MQAMIQALNLRAAEIAMEMQTLEELERDNLGASLHLLTQLAVSNGSLVHVFGVYQMQSIHVWNSPLSPEDPNISGISGISHFMVQHCSSGAN